MIGGAVITKEKLWGEKIAYLQKAEHVQYSICKKESKSEFCAEQYPKTALQLTILLLKNKKFADDVFVIT